MRAAQALNCCWPGADHRFAAVRGAVRGGTEQACGPLTVAIAAATGGGRTEGRYSLRRKSPASTTVDRPEEFSLSRVSSQPWPEAVEAAPAEWMAGLALGRDGRAGRHHPVVGDVGTLSPFIDSLGVPEVLARAEAVAGAHACSGSAERAGEPPTTRGARWRRAVRPLGTSPPRCCGRGSGLAGGEPVGGRGPSSRARCPPGRGRRGPGAEPGAGRSIATFMPQRRSGPPRLPSARAAGGKATAHRRGERWSGRLRG